MPMMRIERMTSPLPRECSTTEPHGRSHGAGDGNRTRVTGLEGQGSTIELHPRAIPSTSQKNCFVLKCWWREMDSNHRRRKPTDLQSASFSHSDIPPPNEEPNYCLENRTCQVWFLQTHSNYVNLRNPCRSGCGRRGLHPGGGTDLAPHPGYNDIRRFPIFFQSD